MRGCNKDLLLLAMMMLTGLSALSSALAEDKPHYGGVLRVALAGDPQPSHWLNRRLEDVWLSVR